MSATWGDGLPHDRHPDPLVESLDYPRPHPGWYGVRAWNIVPMALRVNFYHETFGIADAGPPAVQFTGTFIHPSLDYVREVSRQLLSGERDAFLLVLDSPHHMIRPPLYTEVCYWSTALDDATNPTGPLSVWASGRTVYTYDTDTATLTRRDAIPLDIAAIDWRPVKPNPLLMNRYR